MLYFSGLFQQHYLLSSPLRVATSGAPGDLIAGEIGLFTTDQNGILGQVVLASGTTKNVTFALGSWHTVDAPAPNYQGLQVPQYSKAVQWNSVSLFQYIKGHNLTQGIYSVGWNLSSGSTVGPLFYCATNYYLKLEILGDAALAAVNKNIYNNLDAWGGCCGTDCSSGCTSTAVDAAYILLQWKDRITQNPILNQYVNPQVFVSSGVGGTVEVFDAYDNSLDKTKAIYVPNTANPSSVIAGMQLTVAYLPTTFGTCTFTPRDRFEYTPLWIQASLVTQSGDPCAVNTTLGTSTNNMFATIQQPQTALATGDFVLREYITSLRYRQQNFPDSMNDVNVIRMREIENVTVLNDIPRSQLYDQVVLVHSIPRRSNPTAIHSNDRYMLIFDVPAGTAMNALLDPITNSLSLAGSNVSLETIN